MSDVSVVLMVHVTINNRPQSFSFLMFLLSLHVCFYILLSFIFDEDEDEDFVDSASTSTLDPDVKVKSGNSLFIKSSSFILKVSSDWTKLDFISGLSSFCLLFFRAVPHIRKLTGLEARHFFWHIFLKFWRKCRLLFWSLSLGNILPLSCRWCDVIPRRSYMLMFQKKILFIRRYDNGSTGCNTCVGPSGGAGAAVEIHREEERGRWRPRRLTDELLKLHHKHLVRHVVAMWRRGVSAPFGTCFKKISRKHVVSLQKQPTAPSHGLAY